MDAADVGAAASQAPKLRDMLAFPQVSEPSSSQHRFEGDLKLLESGNFADVTVVCGEKKWNLHKSILIRCEWFHKALTGDFKEAHSNVVTVTEFSHEIIDCVIRYIYTGVIDFAVANIDDSPVIACVRLWVAADFFDFHPLMEGIITLLETYFDEKLVQIALFAAEKGTTGITVEVVNAFIDDLFHGISTVYDCYEHATKFQKIIVDFVHAGRMFFYAQPAFRRLLAVAPHQFAHEVLLATVLGNSSIWTGPNGDCSEYNLFSSAEDNCSWCLSKGNKFVLDKDWTWDPSLPPNKDDDSGLSVRMRWRCCQCVRDHGFKRRDP